MGGNDIIDGDKWLNVHIQFVHEGQTYTADGLSSLVYLVTQDESGKPIIGTTAQLGGKTLEQYLEQQRIAVRFQERELPALIPYLAKPPRAPRR